MKLNKKLLCVDYKNADFLKKKKYTCFVRFSFLLLEIETIMSNGLFQYEDTN